MTKPVVLAESAYWQILRPGYALTDGHVALRPNDGARAGQETPHVHVHVFRRSVEEPRNPFEVLARRVGILPTT